MATPDKLDSNWVRGFTAGDGSFSVTIRKSAGYRLGFEVILGFSIKQHSRDEKLIQNLVPFFSRSGRVVESIKIEMLSNFKSENYLTLLK